MIYIVTINAKTDVLDHVNIRYISNARLPTDRTSEEWRGERCGKHSENKISAAPIESLRFALRVLESWTVLEGSISNPGGGKNPGMMGSDIIELRASSRIPFLSRRRKA
jgi:hypothetical protein